MLRALVVVAILAGPARAAPDLDALVKAAPTCSATRATCLGLAVHVAVGDAGPVASASWISGQLAAANRLFEPIDVGFQIVAVDALPASAMRVRDAAQRSSFRPQVTGTVIHVFVTGQLDDIDTAGAVIRGVTWRGGDTKYIIISTLAFDRVLAHELGHVFGLPHSTYAISIMNKRDRKEPPPEARVFAVEEVKVMKLKLAALLRANAIAAVKAR